MLTHHGPASVARHRIGGHIVEVRIGIVNAPRELSFESKQSTDEIIAAVDAALAAGESTLRLRDEHGSLYVIPSAGIAYVQVGAEESRRVGFVA
jgi:hypothetical protein